MLKIDSISNIDIGLIFHVRVQSIIHTSQKLISRIEKVKESCSK